MTAGVASKTWYGYGWELYQWTTSYAPALAGTWTAVTATPEASPQRAIDVSVTCVYSGLVSIPYGKKQGAYDRKTPPVPVAAGVATVIRLTDLDPKTTYYLSPQWSGTIPATPGGLPQSGASQYGEISAATP